MDNVKEPQAAGDVVPGIVKEKDEAHLINGAGAPLEKKRETEMERQRHKGLQREGKQAAENGGGSRATLKPFSFSLT